MIHHLETNKQNNEFEIFMRFAQIWLPSDNRAEYNEDQKNDIAVNTAAVKHIIIGAATPTEDLVLKLATVVFETLGKDQEFESDHAFLSGTKISHFSVLPNDI